MGRNMKMNSDHMAVGGLKTLRNVRAVYVTARNRRKRIFTACPLDSR